MEISNIGEEENGIIGPEVRGKIRLLLKAKRGTAESFKTVTKTFIIATSTCGGNNCFMPPSLQTFEDVFYLRNSKTRSQINSHVNRLERARSSRAEINRTKHPFANT